MLTAPAGSARLQRVGSSATVVYSSARTMVLNFVNGVCERKNREVSPSPTKMHVSFIQHSTMEPEKSTVTFEARIETRANALISPGGTITLPDCELPAGFEGAKRAAMSAS